MKKVLLEVYKEMATEARIRGHYEQFLKGRFHLLMSKKYDLSLIGE